MTAATIAVEDAEQAVQVVANQAIIASQQGTFAVGGALIDNTSGAVVETMHNNVLMPKAGSTSGFVLHDPTAHGERQLVDWYYDNREALDLPAPDQLTVVTSLDPCAMCAGALLTAGFNVGVSAIDTYAGVNYDQSGTFPTLPPAIRTVAEQTWGYYAVDLPCTRPYEGSKGPVFAGQDLTAPTFLATKLVFDTSVDAVRTASNQSGLSPAQLTDPTSLPAGSPVRQALATLYPNTLTVASSDARIPGPEIAQPLIDAATAASAAGGAFDAVALIDPFGNLLTVTGGQEAASPIRTAFLLATRNYRRRRQTLARRRSRCQAPAPPVSGRRRGVHGHVLDPWR